MDQYKNPQQVQHLAEGGDIQSIPVDDQSQYFLPKNDEYLQNEQLGMKNSPLHDAYYPTVVNKTAPNADLEWQLNNHKISADNSKFDKDQQNRIMQLQNELKKRGINSYAEGGEVNDEDFLSKVLQNKITEDKEKYPQFHKKVNDIGVNNDTTEDTDLNTDEMDDVPKYSPPKEKTPTPSSAATHPEDIDEAAQQAANNESKGFSKEQDILNRFKKVKENVANSQAGNAASKNALPEAEAGIKAAGQEAAANTASLNRLNTPGAINESRSAAQVLNDLPVDTYDALNKLPSKFGGAINKIAEHPLTKDLGTLGAGAGAVVSGAQGAQAGSQLGTDKSTLENIANSAKAIGGGINAGAGMAAIGSGGALAIPSAIAGTVGTGITAAGDAAQDLQNIHNRSIDPKNISAVKEAFTKAPNAQQTQYGPNQLTQPNIVPPNQLAQNLATVPNPALVQGNTPGTIKGPYNPDRPTAVTPPANPPMPASIPEPNAASTDKSSPDYMKGLLDQIKAIQDTHKSDLADAQGRANQNEFYANLGKAANQFSSGVSAMGGHGLISPAKVDNNIQDSLLKTAQSPVKQYEERVANEKNDPNSGLSKAMQLAIAPTFAKINGGNIDGLDHMSFESMNKFAPILAKQVYTSEIMKYNQQKQDTANEFKERTADRGDQRLGMSADTQANRLYQSATKNEQDRLGAASRMQDMINGVRTGRIVDNMQVRAALAADAATLSTPGTNASVADRAKFMSSPYASKMADFAANVVNKPLSTISPENLQQYENIGGVLKDSYANQLRSKTRSLHAGLSSPQEKEDIKNRYGSFVKDYGYEPDFTKENLKAEQTKQHNYNPGDTVTLKNGKQYKVGADGDSLTPI